jgi:hypothetical protein
MITLAGARVGGGTTGNDRCSRRKSFVEVAHIHIIKSLGNWPLLYGMIYLEHVVSQFLVVRSTIIVIQRFEIHRMIFLITVTKSYIGAMYS